MPPSVVLRPVVGAIDFVPRSRESSHEKGPPAFPAAHPRQEPRTLPLENASSCSAEHPEQRMPVVEPVRQAALIPAAVERDLVQTKLAI